MLEGLYWREPGWLLLALYPLLLLLWRRWHRTRVLDTYADRKLQAWVTVPQAGGPAATWRGLAMALCWLLLCLALAGPRLPLQLPPGLAPPAGRLVAVLDLSRSMAATDVLPDRRGRAVSLLRRWLDTEQPPAMGLVVYAGRAHRYLPPTTDKAILRHYLDQLSSLQLPSLGNDLAGGLALAAGELAGEPYSALVLFSDGDMGGDARQAAETRAAALAQAGIAFRVLGVGGPGASPLRDHKGDWLIAGDAPVLSSRDEGWLQSLAAAGDGSYHDAAAPLSLDQVWQRPAARIARQDQDAVLWHELYPWLLAPALVLLFVLLLGRVPVAVRSGLGLATAVLALAVMLPDPARAEVNPLRAAHQALQAGDYETARQRFQGLGGYAGRFGEGVSCYRLGDYDCARNAFADAAWLAEGEQARGRAVFNLANSRFQLGDYERAIALYEDAIRQGVAVAQARANQGYTVELVKEMARLAGVRGETGPRPGRGPRSGPSADGVTPPPDAELGLVDVPADALPEVVKGMDFDALVQRGLTRLQLRETERTDSRRRGLSWAGRKDIAGSVPGALIWQRLFEIEEGFPAPLEQPVSRPGVQPW